ncbi:MAG TPA: hypothetical protein VN841_20410 [Bryobacteraceae bacterium]|nr:hypothetical protein [Bryobacteraceae bacterium]
MLICVDGTGTGEGTVPDFLYDTKFRSGNYAEEKAGSFVGQIYYGSHLQNRRYYQGPDLTGTGPNFIWPYNLCQQIIEFWRQGDHQIFLTGWSRGAAIVIATAAILADLQPMPDGQIATIEAMFLFDAVARSVELSRAKSIPSNVVYCYHAMRDPATNSRRSFGNCGDIANVGWDLKGVTYYVPRKFYTTHGGMGGGPWGAKRGLPDYTSDKLSPSDAAARAQRIDARYFSGGPKLDGSDLNSWVLSNEFIYEGTIDGITNVTVAQEKAGSQAVHDWMWPFLKKHHVLLPAK